MNARRAAAVDVLVRLLTDAPAPDPGERAADPDWAYVESFLRHHGLAGLALAAQRQARSAGDPEPLPEGVDRALEPAYVMTALASQIRMETASRARAALAAADIPCLLFKGAALLRDGTYSDPGARLLEDVDALVAPDAAEHAVSVLCRAGFRPWVPWERSRLAWLPAFTLDDRAAPDGVQSPIDLHWSTRYGPLRVQPTGGVDPLWQGADLEAGLPAREAHFVVIADHFFKHLRVVRHLRGLGDLARLAPRLRDPALLLDHARTRGSERRVRTALGALRTLYGVAVAPEILDAVGELTISPHARRYLAPERLLGTRGHAVGRISGLAIRWRLEGLGKRELLDEIRTVLRPSEPWLRSRYPGADVSALRLRGRYGLALIAWLAGLGPSPLSPNQEIVDTTAREQRS